MFSGYISETLSNPSNPGRGAIALCSAESGFDRVLVLYPEDRADLSRLALIRYSFRVLSGRHSETHCN